jgi:hypothetical protein
MKFIFTLLSLLFTSASYAGVDIHVKMPDGEKKTYTAETGTAFGLGSSYLCEVKNDLKDGASFVQTSCFINGGKFEYQFITICLPKDADKDDFANKMADTPHYLVEWKKKKRIEYMLDVECK